MGWTVVRSERRGAEVPDHSGIMQCISVSVFRIIISVYVCMHVSAAIRWRINVFIR